MLVLMLLWVIGVGLWLCCAQIATACQKTDDAWDDYLYIGR